MECSEVKVKVTQNKTTSVKYRYMKNLLKYSNEEVLLRYWPPLPAGDPSDLGVTSYTKLSEGNFNIQIHIVTGPLCRHIQKLNMDR